MVLLICKLQQLQQLQQLPQLRLQAPGRTGAYGLLAVRRQVWHHVAPGQRSAAARRGLGAPQVLRLQSHAMEAATLCGGGCIPM